MDEGSQLFSQRNNPNCDSLQDERLFNNHFLVTILKQKFKSRHILIPPPIHNQQRNSYLRGMKTKLRKINLNGQDFLFTVSRNYGVPRTGPTLSVRVFLGKFKETPLTIELESEIDYRGNPFFDGVLMENTLTGEKEEVNANDPELISRFIVYAKAKGWNGRTTAPVFDGLEILKEWGYDTSKPWELKEPVSEVPPVSRDDKNEEPENEG